MLGKIVKELRKFLHVFLHEIYCLVGVLPYGSHLASVAWYLKDNKAKKVEKCTHRNFLTKISI
jgi:hypothetical protein